LILRVPITGKLKSYDPKTKVGIGSDDDHPRPLDFEKLVPGCGFRWDAVSYDYEGGMVIVEITFAKIITVTKWDHSKDPPEELAWERESDAVFYERQASVEKLLWSIFQEKTVDELYEITGESRLVVPREK